MKKNHPTPLFEPLGGAEGGARSGQNGSWRDSERTFRYFHVIPFGKMWEMIGGRG